MIFPPLPYFRWFLSHNLIVICAGEKFSSACLEKKKILLPPKYFLNVMKGLQFTFRLCHDYLVKFDYIYIHNELHIFFINLSRLGIPDPIPRPGNSGVSWYPSSQNIFEPAEYF